MDDLRDLGGLAGDGRGGGWRGYLASAENADAELLGFCHVEWKGV